MKALLTVLTVGTAVSLVATSLFPPAKHLIWNRTPSAPEGLYWIKNGPPELGALAIVSATSAEAKWAHINGFVGKDWPLLKRVAGVSGDEVCRKDLRIFINNSIIAEALLTSANGTELPEWTGCIRLDDTQVFLLNNHPNSLDGRYFGPMQVENVDGIAVLIFSANDLSRP